MFEDAIEDHESTALCRKGNESLQFLCRSPRVDCALGEQESFLEGFRLLSHDHGRRGIQAHHVSLRTLPTLQNVLYDMRIVLRRATGKLFSETRGKSNSSGAIK